MKHAQKRRENIEKFIRTTSFDYEFIEAINGKELKVPHIHYSEKKYRLAHGKKTNLSELGCYFSHIEVMKRFLETNYTHALILEDDIVFDSTFETLVNELLNHHKRYDLVRLSGFHSGTPVKIIKLNNGYSLCCNYTKQTGSAAYMVNRKAAKKIKEKLLPMWLPYDHAFDREWRFGVKTMSVYPFPIDQHGIFESQIQATKNYKLPFLKRYATVFPYRCYNEISRVLYRTVEILRQKII